MCLNIQKLFSSGIFSPSFSTCRLCALCSAQVALPLRLSQWNSYQTFSITGFLYRFPNLLLFTSARDLEELTQEVHDFVTMDEEELPNSVREVVKASEASSRLRRHIVWGHLQEMTIPDGRKRFPRLSKIALLVLTIPHSNAGEERVFSMIKKEFNAFKILLRSRGNPGQHHDD